ncbi:DUF5071 domain-containing protein [Undibacterium umbellatum]|uniref:DUF5071 domain-containing protein n=1 Tax=Undibacterium umbellatum TaxID=2762300 RepID=A0ABR6ZAZ2_9BURK|nr:DUF5071 domain-containing protein [Undibacterium umbellatum]MBC3908932.1 DUF5071 domain-containing protein [Undibacterium umbellatum]
MSISDLYPRSSHDHERVLAVIAAGPKAAEPMLAVLFMWLQDINYPIAMPIADFLITVGDPLIPHIKKILRSNDDMWIYWVLQYVVERLSPEHIRALEPELYQLACVAENGIVATRIGASAGIWERKTMDWMLDNKIRAYEEFLLELKELRARTSPE